MCKSEAGCLLLFGLAACGGGGGSSPLYTIGGSVSGLTGTVVLQNNGGNNLSVSANGAFTFPTAVDSASAYAVTVLTQPLGPSCVVKNGSGTASGDVTGVSVACTTDPATFLMPLVANPRQGTTGGANGLFVITTKSLGSPPVRITPETVSPVGYSAIGYTQQFSISSSGNITGGNLDALAYVTSGAAAGDHIWAVDLSATSNLVPRQVSNLTVPSGGNLVCHTFEGFDNLADPSSAFFIFGLCSGSYVLIYLSGTAATAPINLPAFASAAILPLYQPNGMLGGLVAVDSLNNLNFYRDESFTNPTLLLKSVGTFSVLQAPSLKFIPALSTAPTFAFVVVASNGSNSLYRVDYMGAISVDLYNFQFALGSYGTDSNNAYFTDAAGYGMNPGNICRVPLDGSSSALVLYASNSSFYTYASSTGALLILKGLTDDTPELDSLPVGLPGTPTKLASYSAGTPGVYINNAVTSAGDVFVTVEYAYLAPGALTRFYSSEVLAADGTVLQPLTEQSSFFTSLYLSSTNSLLQFRGGGVYTIDLN